SEGSPRSGPRAAGGAPESSDVAAPPRPAPARTPDDPRTPHETNQRPTNRALERHMSVELIETLLVDAGRRIPLLARHLARLQAACAALDYAWPGHAVEDALRAAADALATPGPHRLRLLLDRDGRHSKIGRAHV